MAATETKFFAHEGIVQDQREVPAWSERRQYAELAAEYGGWYRSDTKDERRGSGVIVVLPRPQLPEPENRTVVEAAADKSGAIVILPKNEESVSGE